ncbi:YfbU family protein [Bacillus inaquosorum]|uniref:YfbU family protein n=1 Tax=Bacillus inaquosorum TaxID=483913 RepID=UPI00227E87DD|nr:YfbU family protein [Bacillus inaquosorum]MCY7964988.1 YfbU family protein [Bacillus inaquosorum]MDU7578395.1 YfbU family protein [Bacillus subtilis]
MGLELTKAQRVILINQMEILKKLQPSKEEEYDKYIEILDRGYTPYYSEIFGEPDEELDKDISRQVFDVFDMYQALYFDYQNLTEDEREQINEKDVLFKGYDGNNESQYSFAHFVVFEMERYKFIKELLDEGKIESMNSHRGMAGHYKELLNRYHRIREENNKKHQRRLTLEQIKEVIGK